MNDSVHSPAELGISCVDLDDESALGLSNLPAALMALDFSNLIFLTITLGDLSRQKDTLAVVVEHFQCGLNPRHITVRCSASSGGDVPDSLVDLHRFCQQKNISLFVDFLLNDSADGFGVLAGNANEFSNVLAVSRQLVIGLFNVRWLLPLTSSLVFRLEGIVSLARDEGVEPFLVRANPEDSLQQLTADEKLFLCDFVTYRVLGSDKYLLSSRKEKYYRKLLLNLSDQHYEPPTKRSLRLSYLSSNQSWNTKEQSGSLSSELSILESEKQQAGRYLERLKGTLIDISDVLLNGGLGQLLRLSVKDREKRKDLDGKTFRKALLIGAYGGEHIGDAAILGGVLLRVHKRFGVTESVLLTQRPDHTRHLIPMLDVPVNVSVDEYERKQIKRYVEEADCVVFAGGPLIDIPKQLVRHLYTVSLARKSGKPFIMEGIGPGPFSRWPSLFTADQLVKMADTISLRASDSVEHELVKNLPVDVGLCPAFDYLDTRQAELTRMPDDERVAIDDLLRGTKDRPIIGVNIRPIGHLYTVGAPEGDAATYTRRIEHRFEQRFADGLISFNKKSERKPCFVFFPMNAIQFGMSDLLSAYRIQKLLGAAVDFRVWQADASLDGVLALLRRFDIAITMRFHAAIFALSQDCNVIGIDYRIGKKDKVAGLLDDVGQSENCARIDLLTESWLAGKLESMCAKKRDTSGTSPA